MACPSLDQIARDYADHGVQSVFLYVREAHPGEIYPHHESFEQKLRMAQEFRRLFNIERPILVDDLEGTAHRGFGGLPNMTYILNRSHTVVFRADWTEEETVRHALNYLLDVQTRRREGARLAPFYAELQGYRWVDQKAFDQGLERNGPKALTEFRDATERWARGEHLGSILSRLRKKS